MTNKKCFEAVDNTLRDIRNCDKPMGGITTVLSGDFRQILPVIPRGTRADDINACLKSSYLWPYIHVLQLTTNMRLTSSADSDLMSFASSILSIGDGTMVSSSSNVIDIPFGNHVHIIGELIEHVYTNLTENFNDPSYLYNRTILCPQNECVNDINLQVLDKVEGQHTSYMSVDTICDEDEVTTEFLNSLTPSGCPTH